jgi:hypothetical protein
MTPKTISIGKNGSQVRLGRRRPVARCPRLSLRNYLTPGLPTPPAAVDYSAKAKSAIAEMYDNDKLGDCVIACMGHVVGVLTGNSGTKPLLFKNRQVISLYEAIGGYVPGDPSTDQGCDEQTALNYWQQHGAPAGTTNTIAGWLAVDATNAGEVRTALWLFENLIFGMELPDAWVNPAPSASGFTWDVAGAADPNNGHCVAGVGYDAEGVTIATWGMTGELTDAAVAQYASPASNGELYTAVSHDAISKITDKAPNGFDWSQLIADFDSIGGTVPIPAAVAPLRARAQQRAALVGV